MTQGPTGDQLKQQLIETARQRLKQAQDERAEAERLLAEAQQTGDPLEILGARMRVAGAEGAIETRQRLLKELG